MLKFGSLAIFAALALTGASVYAEVPAAGPSIGVATAVGMFSVDATTVSGSVDLAEGAKLQTTSAPSDVHLQSGANVRLATRSAGTFYADHVSLDGGAARLSNFNGLTLNANQLSIATDDPAAQVLVRLNKKTIEVASIGGAVNVTDSGLLTRVAAGTKMSFQSGANPGVLPPPPAQTGAAPASPAPAPSKMPSDEKTFLWVIGITAVAALVIGLTAAAQGKSPF